MLEYLGPSEASRERGPSDRGGTEETGQLLHIKMDPAQKALAGILKDFGMDTCGWSPVCR